MKVLKAYPLLAAFSMALLALLLLNIVIYPYFINSANFFLSSNFGFDMQIFDGLLAAFTAIFVGFGFLSITKKAPHNNLIKAIFASLGLLVLVYLIVFLLYTAFTAVIDTIHPTTDYSSKELVSLFYTSNIFNVFVFTLKIFLMQTALKISLVIGGFEEKSYLKPTKSSFVQTFIILFIAGIIAIFYTLTIPQLGMQEYIPWLQAVSNWHNLQGLGNLLARYYFMAVSLFICYKCQSKIKA